MLSDKLQRRLQGAAVNGGALAATDVACETLLRLADKMIPEGRFKETALSTDFGRQGCIFATAAMLPAALDAVPAGTPGLTPQARRLVTAACNKAQEVAVYKLVEPLLDDLVSDLTGLAEAGLSA